MMSGRTKYGFRHSRKNNMNRERAGDVRIHMPVFDRFDGLRNDIQSVTKNAIEQTARHLPLHNVTIHIKDDPAGVIPGYAHGGWTLSSEEVQIKLDPHFPNRAQLLTVELPRSVSHELHHAVRNKLLPNEPRSLGAALIREGLATVFETDVWSGEPSAWAKPLAPKEAHDLLVQMNAERHESTYDHARWFFGTGDLPRWAGYSLGVFIVGEYIKLHSRETAASLVAVPADVILDEVLRSVYHE